jgi:hypothetical protein
MIPPSWPFTVWGWISWDHSPGLSAGTISSSSLSTNSQSGQRPPLWSVSPRVLLLPSSSRLSVDLGSQAVSLRTTGPCSKVGSSKSIARTSAPSSAFGSVAHPMSNGQAERANTEILRGLKTRTYDCFKKHGANWVNKLPCVLWGNRTTPSRATGETSFFLVYGAEACLPPEIIMGSPWVQSFDESMQEQLRHEDMDFINECRWRATIQNAWYNQALRRYHQWFMHSRELWVEDLVLRRVLNREGLHKLSPSWEGPFKVMEICRPGCVRLATIEGVPLPNPWNIEHLRKFYP